MARAIAIYFVIKTYDLVVITLPATDKKCQMDSFPSGVPHVQFYNLISSGTDNIEICQSYMTELSSRTSTYVLVQWSRFQKLR